MSLSMRTLRVKTSLAGSRCSPSTLRLSICINQFNLERTTPPLTKRNFSQTTHADLEENDAGDVRVQSRNSGTFNPASGLNALRSRNKLLKETSKTAGQKSHRTILGQSPDIPIRARFAPSPTGYLHLGSLRTALFNSLAAKASNGGAFILRVEDTDQSRLVHDAEERLIRDLKWAGLSWDEGPDCGGKYGPYKQSERLSIYKDHAQTLLDRGHAYRCFCSAEQLELQKRQSHKAGEHTGYPGTCRSIDPSESNRRAHDGESHVVRLKGDAFGKPKFRDAIYGMFQKKDAEEDFVLLKSDGFPTYHLANVIDDHLMEITHVIRGEEWLISTPKHLALYQAFGWQPPTFAHLGLLVNVDGSKLSKRNDSVNLATYQDKGVFPMALLSWLANLGSSFKSNTRPPRTISDIADALTFKFTRGGIKLNLEKLDYFDGKYRDAILWDPKPELSENESALINSYVTTPMLQEIESAAKGEKSSELLPESWRGKLNLVPALANEETKATYVHNIIATKRGDFLSAKALIQQHPYLLWRVPETVYKQSLASYNPDGRVLLALGAAIEDEKLWHAQGNEVMDAIWTSLQDHGIDKLVVYDTLRLVGAGCHDVVSQSSSRMFMLLGREEWRFRLGRVKSIMNTVSSQVV
ncbi:glutamyl-tRNA synthetase [Pochonia chlamydosporia 170]|uniref:Glutamate--tRNA ligase, mitochondrial n=1 Tax=Pochonia chlamydosporia 170 TaxID=1380566 RepID=A0A179FMY8_METCM|nr:glutamyl-tRNA synthetase [Pochonia chlamydosporia 170]OAQ66707.1 glutamyl-tRNA synthetase [Pochonia chlamydosporia 170]